MLLIEHDREQLKSVLAVQRHAELTRLRLLRCEAEVFDWQAEPGASLSLSLKREAKHQPSPKGTLRIEVEFEFLAKSSSESAQHVFRVRCVYDLEYRLSEDFRPSEEQVAAFKDGNAVFNCWPYAREFVHDLTTRMGLQVPPLPLLRIVPKVSAEGPPATRGRGRVTVRRRKTPAQPV